MSQDIGLIKRGLFLLALMSALVIGVLTVVLQRSTSTLPAFVDRPELLAPALLPLVRPLVGVPPGVLPPGVLPPGVPPSGGLPN